MSASVSTALPDPVPARWQAVVGINAAVLDLGVDVTEHPVVMAALRARSASAQLLAADRITVFAGSMPFV